MTITVRRYVKRLEHLYKRMKLRFVPVEREYAGASNKDIFETIYRDARWDRSADGRPNSGPGSHYADLVDPYVEAIRDFVATLDTAPDMLDLGCGDFRVGSRIAPVAASYTACDIVASVVASNSEHYNIPNVEFRTLDLAADPLPPADIVFVRQVLQHISNANIASFLEKVSAGQYRYLIDTESLPRGIPFKPNIDKPSGERIRLNFGSGIDLALPPFNLPHKSARVLCDVPDGRFASIRTTLYELR
ncbi:class I SAM-dependent methyltransferase [Tepidamorphus sp. 3E244]|uniref:class I SAM-dependent methyltransferase n=1 Tax=Tepidamorphus sp. 3E244 TaxID=3385498 RepID=UPI0038FC946D